MAEWFKAHAWKVCVPLQVPWVRIPLSPPFIFNDQKKSFSFKKQKIEKKIIIRQIMINLQCKFE